MIFVGIDPGLTGGLAVVDHSGNALQVEAFEPLDGLFNVHKLSNLLDSVRVEFGHDLFVLVEKVHAFKGQGISSAFSFGCTFGMIQGVVAAKSIRFTLVTPQAWTKLMLAGEDRSDKKNRAKVVAQRSYPNVDLRGSERSRTIHSGIADALLIADYGRRTYAR